MLLAKGFLLVAAIENIVWSGVRRLAASVPVPVVQA
jgi:hypothetical protein